VEYKDYVALKQRIVPQLRFNQAIYEDAVTEHVTEQTVWGSTRVVGIIYSPSGGKRQSIDLSTKRILS
jgi:hypothetical protein